MGLLLIRHLFDPFTMNSCHIKSSLNFNDSCSIKKHKCYQDQFFFSEKYDTFCVHYLTFDKNAKKWHKKYNKEIYFTMKKIRC